MLHIAQDKAEIIFRGRLASDGVQLVRGKAVVGLREADNSQGMDVSLEDGSVIRARYVVGADGSRSTVCRFLGYIHRELISFQIRRLLGIEFKDPGSGTGYDDATAAPAFNAVLSDVYLEEPMPKEIPKDSVSGYLTNFLTLIPLPSHMNADSNASSSKSTSFWRVIYGIPANRPKPPKYPTLEYLQQLMDERNPWDTKITIASVTATSRYRVRDAVATNYFQKLGDGYVLLAGDAAHVHAPVGGQGMNLGICDAVAVAHAIHSHTEAKDSEPRDGVLKQYEESRQRIAIRVVALTKGMTTLINANKGWRRIVRYVLLRLVPYLPFVSRNAAWRMSGLINRDG